MYGQLKNALWQARGVENVINWPEDAKDRQGELRVRIAGLLNTLEDLTKQADINERYPNLTAREKREIARWPRDEGEMRMDAEDMLRAMEEARDGP